MIILWMYHFLFTLYSMGYRTVIAWFSHDQRILSYSDGINIKCWINKGCYTLEYRLFSIPWLKSVLLDRSGTDIHSTMAGYSDSEGCRHDDFYILISNYNMYIQVPSPNLPIYLLNINQINTLWIPAIFLFIQQFAKGNTKMMA